MARLVEEGDDRLLACSDCLERHSDQPPPWGYTFVRAAAQTAAADRFELRRRGHSLEYRVVDSPTGLPGSVAVWQTYEWEGVACYGCVQDISAYRTFDPRNGEEISLLVDEKPEDEPPMSPPPN